MLVQMILLNGEWRELDLANITYKSTTNIFRFPRPRQIGMTVVFFTLFKLSCSVIRKATADSVPVAITYIRHLFILPGRRAIDKFQSSIHRIKYS